MICFRAARVAVIRDIAGAHCMDENGTKNDEDSALRRHSQLASSSSTQSPTRRLQTILRVPAFEDCVHAYLTLYWHSEIAATRVCVFGFVFEVYVNIVCSPWGENIWPPTSTSCKFPLSPPSHLVLQYLVPSVEEFGGFCRPHVEEFSSFMLSTEV